MDCIYQHHLSQYTIIILKGIFEKVVTILLWANLSKNDIDCTRIRICICTKNRPPKNGQDLNFAYVGFLVYTM